MRGCLTLVLVVFAAPLALGQEPTRTPEPTSTKSSASLVDGKTVAEWVVDWESRAALSDRDAIAGRLVKAGASMVPDMLALLEANGPATGLAIQVLEQVGAAAAPALPKLLEIVRTRGDPDATGRDDSESTRQRAFFHLSSMGWAAASLVPVLVAVADDAQEKGFFRATAVRALGEIGEAGRAELAKFVRRDRSDGLVRNLAISTLAHSGEPGIAVVEPVARDASDPCHFNAQRVLADLYEESGIESRESFYAKLIDADPWSEQVLGWLVNAKNRLHLDRPHALTERVKSSWRARLAEHPDPGLAMQLALLIQDELENTAIDWECGDQGSRKITEAKESPLENYATLAEAIEIGRRCSVSRSPIWSRLTLGLAKLRLLQGDWAGMNAALTELGEPPIPDGERRWLTAPPSDWTDLATHWRSCDASLRKGDCTFELTIEKDGRGMRGAHVVVREVPRESRGIFTGVRIDTLAHLPDPLESEFATHSHGFGWGADWNRAQTRYVVTDDSGVARFEGLPVVPLGVEVFIPVAAFPEPGSQWDLWVARDDGALELQGLEFRKVFELASGTTVHAPRLVVKPRFAMNLVDGQAIDPASFDLTWAALPQSEGAPPIRYEVELAVGFPESRPLNAEYAATLANARTSTTGCSWPIGAQGVGGIKLVPGNLYLVQITARDDADRVLARCGRTWCHVPWTHRASAAPRFGSSRGGIDSELQAPIEARLWFSGEFHSGDGRVETLPERLSRFAREQPDAFELEYVAVARAWLDWRDGSVDAARAALTELVQRLPAGNVAAETARGLLRRIAAIETPGRELLFVANSP